MAYYYADSSMLVRRHAAEMGTLWVQTLTNPAANNSIITSQISTVGVLSAFQRKHREGGLTAIQVTQLTTDFLAVCTNEYDLVDVTAAILGKARTLVQQHPLRAYDAVQLASASLANTSLQAAGVEPLLFLAGDRQLLNAALAEGFAVDSPNLHP